MRKATGRMPVAAELETAARVGLLEAEAADLKDSGCIQKVSTVLKAIKARPTTNAPCMRSEGLRHFKRDQGIEGALTTIHGGSIRRQAWKRGAIFGEKRVAIRCASP